MISSKIINIEQINSDTKLFTFILNKKINYIPGQYISILDKNHLNHEIKRTYSIVEYNNENSKLKIIIKRVPNGYFSRKMLDEAQIGDNIIIEQINGRFILPTNIKIYSSIFFFAAGSGIAPIYSLIHALLLQHHYKNDIYLLYSTKNEKDTILYNELNYLQNKFPNFKIDFVYSQSTNPKLQRRVSNNFITEYLQAKAISTFNSVAYICGPIEYMDIVSITLLTEGFKKENIKKEVFYNEEIDLSTFPPDTNKYNVKIKFLNGISHTIQVQYPNSILNAAINQGIKLPYSCGSGQCGSCVAKCTKGEVWMRYNEILTEKEIKNGIILTCQAFPIYGNIEIEF